MFLRGHGYQDHVKNNGSRIGNTNTRHQSGNLGEIQGDSARKWQAAIRTRVMIHDRAPIVRSIMWSDEFFEKTEEMTNQPEFPSSPNINIDSFHNWHNLQFNGYYGEYDKWVHGRGPYHLHTASPARMTPMDNENRPVNMAVKYIIKAR